MVTRPRCHIVGRRERVRGLGTRHRGRARITFPRMSTARSVSCVLPVRARNPGLRHPRPCRACPWGHRFVPERSVDDRQDLAGREDAIPGVSRPFGEDARLDQLLDRLVRLRHGHVEQGRQALHRQHGIILDQGERAGRGRTLPELATACPVLAQSGKGPARDEQLVHGGDHGVGDEADDGLPFEPLLGTLQGRVIRVLVRVDVG